MMNDYPTRKKAIIIGLLALVVAGIGYGFYSYHRTIRNLKASMSATRTELGEQKAYTDSTVKELVDAIAALQGENSTLASDIRTQKEKSTIIAEQVGSVSSSIGELEKLSRTDPELLKKYSKVYFLNEHYVPLSLVTIDPQYIYNPARIFEIHASVWPHLLGLLTAANNDGMKLKIDSAFRSFGTQAVLKSTYRFTYGSGTANSFSAEQGYSEHQLGTTVDFTSQAINGALAGFDKTAEYAWLMNNAHKFGFILSYPKNNAYYTYEPWHWRYVGVKLATDLHAKGKYFYDTDQREIDGYLVNLFD